MNEDHRVEVNKTTFRDGSSRKEVAGPQCLCMNLQELIPSSPAAFRTRISALLFQDILDGLPTDTANPQLTELTKNPRVTEVCFRSNMTNQFAKIAARSTSLHTLRTSFFFADPAMECCGRDDADQRVDVFA